jgi:hypothetical protein
MSFRTAIVLAAGILRDLVCASPLPLSPSQSLTRSAVIDLGYSRYQGIALSNGVDEYLGMRYAKSPLKELRFRAPEDPELTDGVVDATAVSSSASPMTVSRQSQLTSTSSDLSALVWANTRVNLWERTAYS